MEATVANCDFYFSLADGLPEEEFGHLPVCQKLPFCDYHDSEITAPRFQNGRVAFTVFLFSCKLQLIFEGADNFTQSGGFARGGRGVRLYFLDCTIRKRGEIYEYALTEAGGGAANFTFRSAYARTRGNTPAAEFISDRLAEYRERLRAVTLQEPPKPHLPAETERFPDANFFFFPYFQEKAELGTLRKQDRPFYALWRLYAALSEGEIEGEDKAEWRLVAGGYLRYFRDCGYDLSPLLQKYAPRWAKNFSAAMTAYRERDFERLSLLTAEHLAGKWYPLEGKAAMRYADILSLSEYGRTPQGRQAQAREQAYEDEFVRALCRAASDLRAKPTAQ